jgi:hypothetical protein
MDSRTRRVLAAAIGLAAVVVGLAAACRPGGGHHPPGPTTTTTGTLPGPAPGAIDCGTIDYASGAPTTRLVDIRTGPGKCFSDAFATGQPARLVTTGGSTPEGPYGAATFDVLSPGQLRVVSEDGSLVQLCTNLSTSTSYLLPGSCTPQPPAAPPWTGTDCGTIPYASGWPTTIPFPLTMGAGKCFTDAWAAGTPARLVTRDQTDGHGGHIRIVIYDILGPGQLRVTTDARQSAPPGPVTTERCTGLAVTGNRLSPQDCTPA